MNVINKINPRWFTWTVMLFFACIYVSISIYNHYNFRTFAFDLGIKNQVIWDYAHGRMNYNSILPELDGRINVLANHFEPILFLLAPFYYLFGSYTLLIFQIVFILVGGYGIYKYIAEISGDRIFSTTAMAMFYAMWGVFAALSFDFHTNVLAAVIVPWLFYAIQRKKHWVWAITLAIILLCKENVAIWMFFVGLGIFFHWRKDKKRRSFGLYTAGISVIYFVLVMKYAMPFFADGKLAYMHFKYSALGNNWTEALKTVFTKPGYVFRLLFENHHSTGDMAFNEKAKWELHTFVFLSGGVFLLLRPQFLIMLIPVYMQKLMSDDPGKWSIYGQYSIEFVPIIVLATFCFINKSESQLVKVLAGLVLFLASFDATKEFIGFSKPLPYGKYLTNFYQPSHYKREFEIKEINYLIKALPKDASVSSMGYVIPHIADRKNIYQFPVIKNADFILLVDDQVNYYPLENLSFREKRDSLLNSGLWNIQLKTDHGYLLQRK